jgi:dimethylargininase
MDRDATFTTAIVREPCPEMVRGLSSAGLGTPDFSLAIRQHARYVAVLKECGLRVTVLGGDGRYPDSTFIEDVAVCTPHCAVVTNPGAESRRGEISGMKDVLAGFYEQIEAIRSPGTLEGGDVLTVGGHTFVGISGRTNREGAEQLIGILRSHGMTGSMVSIGDMLHLKSGVSHLGGDTLLSAGDFGDNPAFTAFKRIHVGPREEYAANSVRINGKVLVPSGHPETRMKIRAAGFETIEVDVSEYRKLDGGLSCLSLRF